MNQDLYASLVAVAKKGEVTRYSDVAPLVGLDMGEPEHRGRMGELLDEISLSEHERGHPLLSAVVIHKDDNMPGDGFFALARRLGLFARGERFVFFVNELRRVHDHWRRAA